MEKILDLDKQERFTVKPEHIALLRSAYVSWDSCEYGAPGINCKRPFGNSGSQIYIDMAEILKIKPALIKDGEYIFSDEQEDYMDTLYRELENVLQIVLVTGSFELGVYEKKDWYASRSWYKIQTIKGKEK